MALASLLSPGKRPPQLPRWRNVTCRKPPLAGSKRKRMAAVHHRGPSIRLIRVSGIRTVLHSRCTSIAVASSQTSARCQTSHAILNIIAITSPKKMSVERNSRVVASAGPEKSARKTAINWTAPASRHTAQPRRWRVVAPIDNLSRTSAPNRSGSFTSSAPGIRPRRKCARAHEWVTPHRQRPAPVPRSNAATAAVISGSSTLATR